MTITPIHGELRQAAHERLIELANELMRCAQSLILKSGRIMNPDPKVHHRVLAGLTTYRGHALPGSDEVLLIQALLTGTSPEQCQSRAEKGRLKKAARDQKQHEIWERIKDSPNAREAHRREFPRSRPRVHLRRQCDFRPLEYGRIETGARQHLPGSRGPAFNPSAWRVPGVCEREGGRNSFTRGKVKAPGRRRPAHSIRTTTYCVTDLKGLNLLVSLQ